nr:reverse transcriptase domain-containing protein [Tanacetum cinerariifolium]
MRTRSSSNRIIESSKILRRRNKRSQQQVAPTIVEIPIVTMVDQRTMAELLQAPTEGYEDAIVVPAILAFPEVAALTDAVKALLRQNKTQTPASVKAVEDSCVTCGGPHPYYNCTATDGNIFKDNIQEYVSAAAVNYNQVNTGFCPQVATNYRANQISPPVEPLNEFSSYKKITETSIRAMQNQITNLKAEMKNEIHSSIQNQINNVKNELKSDISNQTNELRNMFASYFKKNIAFTSGSRPLPSNTIANQRGDLKAITTRSGFSYDGPPIPPPFSSLPKVVERVPEVTKDTVQLSTENIQPPVVQNQVSIDEPIVAPKPKPVIPYPSRANKQKLREKDDILALKFVEIFKNLHFNLSFADALLHMPKFAIMFKSILNKKEKLFDLATTSVNENCSAVILKLPEKLGDSGKFLIPCDFPKLVKCLALADLGESINLMPLSIWKNISLPELTPTRMILELADRSTTRLAGIAEDVFVKVGKFHFPTNFVVVDYVVDPRVPLILGRPFLRTIRALIDVYGTDKLPVIISKELKDDEEKSDLLKVLKSHKWAIAWKISDIKGISTMNKANQQAFVKATKETCGGPHPYCECLATDNNTFNASAAIGTYNQGCSSHPQVPLILRRLFLRMARALLDVHDSSTSGNPTPSNPIIASSSPSFTPFKEGEFILEEIEIFLRTPDEISNLDDDYYDTEGDIHSLEKFLNEDPSPNLPPIKNEDLKQVEVAMTKPSIEEPPELELKDLPSYLEYAILEGTNKLPIIISKELKNEEKAALLKVLKSHKRAIAWKISDIKGAENLAADHLSRLENPHQDDLKKKEINETFPLETLGMISFHSDSSTPWLADIANYHAENFVVKGMSSQKKKFFKDGGHHDANYTAKKVFYSGFYWSMIYCGAQDMIKSCDSCLKCILERTVCENHASWFDKLDDALWAFRTTYKTPSGCTPYKLVYGKACHLPIELRHKAYWTLKHCNFDLKTTGDHQNVQLNEFNELRDQAYENSLIYKEKTKKIHDSKIKNRVFNVGDRVLLFNSHLNIFSRKLKTRWTGPFTVAHVFPYGTIELSQAKGPTFKAYTYYYQLKVNTVRHTLTTADNVNPTIYTSCVEQFWATAKVKNINGEAQLHAKVDGKKVVISEASIRRDLRFGDAGGYNQLEEMAHHTRIFVLPSHTKKVFGNITRVGKDFSGKSNDPPFSRVNVLGSGEDRLKLKELMELYTNLSDRVLKLETIKTSQAQEVSSLKRRVKRLKKKKRLRTHGLKRLYKVGLSARVESFADEESLGEEDASKQERISDIDTNQDIYLVNVHRDKDIFGINDQDDTLMFDVDKDLQEKINADYELAQRLQGEEQGQLTDAEKARFFMEFLEKRRKFFATKRAEEKRSRPPTQAQTELVEKSTKKDRAEIAHKSSSKRAGDKLNQERSKKQKIEG